MRERERKAKEKRIEVEKMKTKTPNLLSKKKTCIFISWILKGEEEEACGVELGSKIEKNDRMSR